jgi:hypothetical protein
MQPHIEDTTRHHSVTCSSASISSREGGCGGHEGLQPAAAIAQCMALASLANVAVGATDTCVEQGLTESRDSLHVASSTVGASGGGFVGER